MTVMTLGATPCVSSCEYTVMWTVVYVTCVNSYTPPPPVFYSIISSLIHNNCICLVLIPQTLQLTSHHTVPVVLKLINTNH